MFAKAHFHSAADNAHDLSRRTAQIESLSALHDGGVHAKKVIIHQVANLHYWIARIYALNELRFEVFKIDARERFGDVQLAGFPLLVHSIPVEHPVGSV